MSDIHYRVDVSDAMRELHRLDDGPDLGTQRTLDAILTGLFQESQAAVHVITGSLRASGRHESRTEDGTWRGEISYGGALGTSLAIPGPPNDPVRYAEIEQHRGDTHDFMRGLHHADGIYIAAILEYLRGEL